MTDELTAKWREMNAMQQSAAIDTLSSLFVSMLDTLCADLNGDLARRGVPYKLRIKIDLLPAAEVEEVEMPQTFGDHVS